MSTELGQLPESLPLLSRGKHRRPRNGACAMEYASFLAGERWTDHPTCTHPLLAELARQVNDFTSDDARQSLVELVPDLIGLTGSDLRIDVRIALRTARAAVPVVSEEQQRMMATAVLTCERLLAELDGCPGRPMSQDSADALALAPGAAAWARRFIRGTSVSYRVFRRQSAPSIVRYGVRGIAHACVPDPDLLLRGLLAGSIEECKRMRPSEPELRLGTDSSAATRTMNAEFWSYPVTTRR